MCIVAQIFVQTEHVKKRLVECIVTAGVPGVCRGLKFEPDTACHAGLSRRSFNEDGSLKGKGGKSDKIAIYDSIC
jgi:hypothetical protein